METRWEKLELICLRTLNLFSSVTSTRQREVASGMSCNDTTWVKDWSSGLPKSSTFYCKCRSCKLHSIFLVLSRLRLFCLEFYVTECEKNSLNLALLINFTGVTSANPYFFCKIYLCLARLATEVFAQNF